MDREKEIITKKLIVCLSVLQRNSVRQFFVLKKGKGKGKVHPITFHEDPERSKGIALLFL
jgi:hypothetical protein